MLEGTAHYEVLARKHRPSKFSELVGQDVLVQTLSNAIKNNRIAHAFILTGIRGIGKTTTARLIAKSLNCIGKDAIARETTEPCCICKNCISIARSNHQDVIEIDAASRTGVEGIREIIENVNYAPVSSKYKIYIIDEVHMLSNSAFNALLKTLEEPPAHVKFIFATTEIRKVPITILSRCQRFDLRRLNTEEIIGNLQNILTKEGITAEEKALSLIANASEGSARDSLSLLDRAISHNEHGKTLSIDSIAKMLGIGEKNMVINLFEKILKGDIESVLETFNKFYENSIDISTLLQDLLDINHQITLAKTIKNYQKTSNLPEEQAIRILEIANNVSISSLTKIWQMLLKGINEINYSSNQKIAMEMLLIRVCHASTLPNINQITKHIDTTKEMQAGKAQEIKIGAGKNHDDTISNNSTLSKVLNNFPNSEVIT